MQKIQCELQSVKASAITVCLRLESQKDHGFWRSHGSPQANPFIPEEIPGN